MCPPPLKSNGVLRDKCISSVSQWDIRKVQQKPFVREFPRFYSQNSIQRHYLSTANCGGISRVVLNRKAVQRTSFHRLQYALHCDLTALGQIAQIRCTQCGGSSRHFAFCRIIPQCESRTNINVCRCLPVSDQTGHPMIPSTRQVKMAYVAGLEIIHRSTNALRDMSSIRCRVVVEKRTQQKTQKTILSISCNSHFQDVVPFPQSTAAI